MPVQVAAAAKKEPQTRIQFTSLWNPKIKNIGSRQKEKKTGQRNWGCGPKKERGLRCWNEKMSQLHFILQMIQSKKYKNHFFHDALFFSEPKNSNQNTALSSLSQAFPHKLKKSQMHWNVKNKSWIYLWICILYICEHWTMSFYFWNK